MCAPQNFHETWHDSVRTLECPKPENPPCQTTPETNRRQMAPAVRALRLQVPRTALRLPAWFTGVGFRMRVEKRGFTGLSLRVKALKGLRGFYKSFLAAQKLSQQTLAQRAHHPIAEQKQRYRLIWEFPKIRGTLLSRPQLGV